MPNDVLLKYYRARVFYLRNNFFQSILQDYVNPILRELLGKYLRVIKLDKDIDYLLLHNLNALPLAEYIKHTTGAKIVLYIHNPTSPFTLRKIMRVKSKHKYNADII
ncbi:MAG: hypothetical protein J7L38_06260, partial [Thermoproteales archaeon]|nr:hypothetical protein [Thermoproteales archaeon]